MTDQQPYLKQVAQRIGDLYRQELIDTLGNGASEQLQRSAHAYALAVTRGFREQITSVIRGTTASADTQPNLLAILSGGLIGVTFRVINRPSFVLVQAHESGVIQLQARQTSSDAWLPLVGVVNARVTQVGMYEVSLSSRLQYRAVATASGSAVAIDGGILVE